MAVHALTITGKSFGKGIKSAFATCLIGKARELKVRTNDNNDAAKSIRARTAAIPNPVPTPNFAHTNIDQLAEWGIDYQDMHELDITLAIDHLLRTDTKYTPPLGITVHSPPSTTGTSHMYDKGNPTLGTKYRYGGDLHRYLQAALSPPY